MNKIIVLKNKKIKSDVNNDIIINDFSKVNIEEETSLLIWIKKNVDTSLELFLEDDTFLNIHVYVDANATLNLFKYKGLTGFSNHDYHITLNDNSCLTVNKFNYNNKGKEKININLKGLNSVINYNFSTLVTLDQSYIMNIKHNNKKTKSRVNNHGVTIKDAKLDMEVNSYVKKGMEDCVVIQENKIITLGDNNSVIKPNLYIDEYRVEAKHGASIGKFAKEQLFYLQARGLKRQEAYDLLIKGFLLGILTIHDKQKQELKSVIENVGGELNEG